MTLWLGVVADRMYMQGSVVIFLGPPGCGKGTQAVRLSSELQIPAISTGEMLRQACQSGCELGKAVRSVLDSGELVSDKLMNKVVAQRLLEPDCRYGCILDGYPRTLPQAEFLSTWLNSQGLPDPVVVDFHLFDSEIVARLSRRRVCGQCGRVYSANLQTGMASMICEADGSLLSQRADDRAEVIRARLEIYHANAEQLVRYYQAGNYLRLSAAGSPDAVAAQLVSHLGTPVETSTTIPSANRPAERPAYGV